LDARTREIMRPNCVGLFPMLALATSVHLLPRKVFFDLIYMPSGSGHSTSA
jgi:hypothetical protein